MASLTNPGTSNGASPAPPAAKRCRSASLTVELETTYESIHNNTFFIIEAVEEGDLSKVSPFIVERVIRGAIGTARQIKKLRSGKLLVEITRNSQVNNLLKITTLSDIPVKVSPHRSLNQCKGVIRSPELASLSQYELESELQKHNVTDVKKIFIKRDGITRNTNTIVLTFNTSTLPTHINIAYLRVRVEPFIPNPLRCFKCQRFGHHSSACKRDSMCSKCGLPDHGESECTRPPCCANCEGDHPANSNKCPKWLREKEICKIKTLQGISFPEARKLVDNNSQSNSITYSNIVRSDSKKTRTIGTQTEVTNCTCDENYVHNDTSETTRKNIDTDTHDLQAYIDSQATGSQMPGSHVTITPSIYSSEKPENAAKGDPPEARSASTSGESNTGEASHRKTSTTSTSRKQSLSPTPPAQHGKPGAARVSSQPKNISKSSAEPGGSNNKQASSGNTAKPPRKLVEAPT